MKFLDCSDLNGVVHPRQIKYLRYVRFWLRILGAWPKKTDGEEKTTLSVLYTYYNSILPPVCGYFMVAFLVTHCRVWTFFEMGQVYINTFMCMVYNVRQYLTLTTKYEKLHGQFVNEIHMFHHKHRSDYAMKMHLFLHKLSYLFTMYTIGTMLWGFTLYNSIPLYNNWVGGGYGKHMPANFTYEYAINYELPFDYRQNLKVHIPTFIFDVYSGFSCTLCFCINDLFLSLQMFHLWGHLKILIYNMENFPKPAHRKDDSSERDNYYTAEEQKDVSQKLDDIISHHNLILRNMENISETFGPAIATYYLFHILSNCVLLLEISSLDPIALIRYGPLSLILLQSQIQISAVFELLSSMSEKLIRAAYSLPWEYMDVSDRRTVQVILTLSQRPLGLMAIGMVEVGMKTTVSILKTTLSYFVMLRTIATK